MDKVLLSALSEITDEEKDILGGKELDKKLYSATEEFIINDARLFFGRGEVGVRTHTRFAPFPTHKHSFIEMMIVLSGGITHRIEGKTLTLGEGDILFLNKHASHSIDRADKTDIGVNVILSDRFVYSLLPELSGTVFDYLISENFEEDGEGVYLSFATKGERRVENLVENLLFELTNEGEAGLIMSQTLALLLNLLSSSAESLLKVASNRGDKITKRKMKIISYVKGNYRQASLPELAKQMFLTPQYLSQFTKKHLGKTFKELVVEERIERAKELLVSTDLAINEIIRSLGYENSSYFHREFKKATALSPLVYRKQGRKDLTKA